MDDIALGFRRLFGRLCMLVKVIYDYFPFVI